MSVKDLLNKATGTGRRRVRNYLVRPRIQYVDVGLGGEVTNPSGERTCWEET